MKSNYFSVTECNGYRIKIRSQLIGKILLNIIFKCASALFYATRQILLVEQIQNGGLRCIFCSSSKTGNKTNYNQKCLLIHEINYANTSQPAI